MADNLQNFFLSVIREHDLSDLTNWTMTDFYKKAHEYLDLNDIEQVIDSNFKQELHEEDKIILILCFRQAVSYFCSRFEITTGEKCVDGQTIRALCDCIKDIKEKSKEFAKKLNEDGFPEAKKEKIKKRELLFKRIERERVKHGFNISSYIQNESQRCKLEGSVSALRRGYYLWRDRITTQPVLYWPSKAFIDFISLLGVYYTELSPGEYNILGIRARVQVWGLWEQALILRDFEGTTKERDSFRIIDGKYPDEDNDKFKKLKSLITQKNIFALEWAVTKGARWNSTHDLRKYKLILALRGYKTWRNKMKWDQGFPIPSFQPYLKRVRIVHNYTRGKTIIPAYSILNRTFHEI